MTTNAQLKADRDNLAGADHLPSCPRCGNLCAQVDKWCADCGVWLRLDPPRSSELRSRAMQAAPPSEDVQAANGTDA